MHAVTLVAVLGIAAAAEAASLTTTASAAVATTTTAIAAPGHPATRTASAALDTSRFAQDASRFERPEGASEDIVTVVAAGAGLSTAVGAGLHTVPSHGAAFDILVGLRASRWALNLTLDMGVPIRLPRSPGGDLWHGANLVTSLGLEHMPWHVGDRPGPRLDLVVGGKLGVGYEVGHWEGPDCGGAPGLCQTSLFHAETRRVSVRAMLGGGLSLAWKALHLSLMGWIGPDFGGQQLSFGGFATEEALARYPALIEEATRSEVLLAAKVVLLIGWVLGGK